MDGTWRFVDKVKSGTERFFKINTSCLLYCCGGRCFTMCLILIVVSVYDTVLVTFLEDAGSEWHTPSMDGGGVYVMWLLACTMWLEAKIMTLKNTKLLSAHHSFTLSPQNHLNTHNLKSMWHFDSQLFKVTFYYWLIAFCRTCLMTPFNYIYQMEVL